MHLAHGSELAWLKSFLNRKFGDKYEVTRGGLAHSVITPIPTGKALKIVDSDLFSRDEKAREDFVIQRLQDAGFEPSM